VKNYLPIGVHIILDLKNIHNFLLHDIETVEFIMCKAAELSGAKILSVAKHKFEPAGFTCVVLLSESHFSIHTYLDMDDFVNGFGSAYIDAYTCGEDCIPMIGINYLIDRLCTDESIVSMKVLKRGLDSGIIDLSEMCEGMC